MLSLLTVDASMDPPNQTAYRCMWCVMTCTSMGLGYNTKTLKRDYTPKPQVRIKLPGTTGGDAMTNPQFTTYFLFDSTIFKLTFSLPPLNSSLIFRRASTVLFRSLCRRRPKSLNMVDPPDSTMFYQTGKRRKDAVTHSPELPET